MSNRRHSREKKPEPVPVAAEASRFEPRPFSANDQQAVPDVQPHAAPAGVGHNFSQVQAPATPLRIQAKLMLGSPEDHSAPGTDSAADHLNQALQAKAFTTTTRSASVGDPVLQAQGDMRGDRHAASAEQRPNQTGLPDALKSGIESLSGISLDHVKVHYNSAQPAQLNALAYAQGNDIHVASGQEKHLPHEAWHVVQQAQGRVKPTMQMKGGVPVNDDAGLEHEADVMGARAAVVGQPTSDTAPSPAVQRPAISSSPAGGSSPVQRSELEAAVRANQVHPAGVYVSWGGITAARTAGIAAITTNWKSIADAYVAPGRKFGGTGALDVEAARLMADVRSWTDPQARREADNVLSQMAAMSKALGKQLLRLPNNASKQHHIDAIYAQLHTLDARIAQIKTKFLLANRVEGAGSEKPGWFNKEKRTVLELPQGNSLELYNKINPATNREQRLGAGGLGYGAFGKMGGETTFVKKQKLKKNEQSAAAGVGMPLFEQPDVMQVQQLAWIQEEMEKFRNELDITTNVLNHANVLKTYGGAIGVGKDGASKAYIAAEMMTGGDIKSVIAAGTATDATKKAIMLDALAGLAHVHAANLIHRDIKPDNIMLNSVGTAKLIDFGEAVRMDGAGEYRTRTKAGTVGYYHPVKIVAREQAHQELIYDVSTDLYALQKTFEQLAPHFPALTAWIATFPAVNNANTLRNNLVAIVVP
jgi:serine/threonine protein kinase